MLRLGKFITYLESLYQLIDMVEFDKGYYEKEVPQHLLKIDKIFTFLKKSEDFLFGSDNARSTIK